MKPFEKILIGTILCPLMLFTACANAGNGEGGTTAADDSGNASQTTEETNLPETVTVSKDGVCGYTVVRSMDAGSSMKRLCTEFRTELARRSGGEVAIGDDFIAYNESVDPAAKELLVGDTTREESIRLREILDSERGPRYGIYVAGPKIAVIGSDTYSTYLGLLHIFEEMTGEDGKGELSFEKGYTFISDESEKYFPDIAEARKNRLSLCFSADERVIKQVPNEDGYVTMQGGGTDGTYAYYGMINKASTEAVIYKYEIATWKLVKKSAPLPTFHTNDITYDSKNKRLVISTCMKDDYYRGMCTVDPDSLELIESFTIDHSIRALDYLPWCNRFLLGTNYYFTLTDENFNKINTIDSISKQYTTQGLCCDEKYIYDVRFVNGSDTHYIVVHDFEGNYYGELPLIGAPSEPENMFRLGNEFFLGCNGADAVLRVELLPEKFW